MHPTFATVTTPVELDQQHHRAIRVLLLSAALAITVALTFTDGGFLATHGTVLAVAPLVLVGLITIRMIQWIRDLDRTAQDARTQAESDPLTGLRSIQGLRAFVSAATSDGPELRGMVGGGVRPRRLPPDQRRLRDVRG